MLEKKELLGVHTKSGDQVDFQKKFSKSITLHIKICIVEAVNPELRAFKIVK